MALTTSTERIDVIVSINDVHSYVESSCALWGALAAQRHKHTLVCDAGDFFEGTLFYQRYGGRPELDMMDTLIDFACPGNHGFGLLRTHHFESCKVLCLNVMDHAHRPLFQTHHLFRTPQGVYALTGVMSQQAFETIPIEERAELFCRDHISALTQFLDEVQQEVDGVVVMSHSGLEQDVARMPCHPLLKLVLSAHCHHEKHTHQRDGLWCAKAPHHAEGYLRVELEAETLSVSVVPVAASVSLDDLPSSLHGLRHTLMDYHREAHHVFGVWDGCHDESAPHAHLAWRLLQVAREHGPDGVHVGVLNTTCMREIPSEGAVTARMLGRMFPFGNTLVYGVIHATQYKQAVCALREMMGHNAVVETAWTESDVDVLDAQVQPELCVLTTSHLWANVFEPHGGLEASKWMSVRQCFIEHVLHPQLPPDKESSE